MNEQIYSTTNPYGQEIRAFADSGLQASIDKALAGIPVGKHGAVLGLADLNPDGSLNGRLIAVAKLNDDWSVMGVFRHDFKAGTNTGEAVVRWTF